MPQLRGRARASLPKTAFAYVDSKGQRRLPIHDEPHVRNALARFNQVKFEDDAARERARRRLLTAAKKHGILPIGFITGQLATERLEGESTGRGAMARALPTGQVTFLLTDIEDSTGLLRRLGDGYATLLGDLRRLLRRAVQRAGGREVDVRADELFAVFKRPASALQAAVTIQRMVLARAWPDGARVRVRMGLHTGRPTVTDGGYVGLAVHTAARICAAGHGGPVLLSDAAGGPSRPRLRRVCPSARWVATGSRGFPSRRRASSWRRRTSPRAFPRLESRARPTDRVAQSARSRAR
jgi:class 3 adenylate cyclase